MEDEVDLAEVVAAMVEVMGEVVMIEEVTIVVTVHPEVVIVEEDTEEGPGVMRHINILPIL